MEGLIFLFIYGFLVVAAAVAGGLLYRRSVRSRKRYCCPKCGEQISVELMEAGHCNLCGTPLRGPMKEITNAK